MAYWTSTATCGRIVGQDIWNNAKLENRAMMHRTPYGETIIRKENEDEAHYKRRFIEYVEFQEKHGHAPKASSKDFDERSLAHWRSNMCRLKNIARLSPEWREQLEKNGILG